MLWGVGSLDLHGLGLSVVPVMDDYPLAVKGSWFVDSRWGGGVFSGRFPSLAVAVRGLYTLSPYQRSLQSMIRTSSDLFTHERYMTVIIHEMLRKTKQHNNLPKAVEKLATLGEIRTHDTPILGGALTN